MAASAAKLPHRGDAGNAAGATGLLLGAIADDFTGATDLANNLVRHGMRTMQTIGVPEGPPPEGVDAIVVALKSRTAPVDDAVAAARNAFAWLDMHGARQIYFKYCSTFDSTPNGNIGPVIDALMDALAGRAGAALTVATPAFPDNGRTIYNGHLFVGHALLNESGMQDHPLTPMRDANLVRVLQAQLRRRVGLVDHRVVREGPDAIRAGLAALERDGIGVAIVDAIENDDLFRLAAAVAGRPLVTAGSGLAIGLPANFGLVASDRASALPPAHGRRAIVAGSCSMATQRQVRAFVERGGRAFAIDPLRLANDDVVREALAWSSRQRTDETLLVSSTADADAVAAVQSRLGVERAGARVERALAAIARGLVEQGVGQLIVAGGETSGACVDALGIASLRIGPQIDPGVPWCHAESRASGGGLHLALKSGNFGGDDFFTRAFAVLR
jgi:3-dehydrotetronate 4-kinase